jgi:hypothetical protein
MGMTTQRQVDKFGEFFDHFIKVRRVVAHQDFKKKSFLLRLGLSIFLVFGLL